MSLFISNEGLALIKKFEGCRLTAYQDSVGIWTIGYGHTANVAQGQTITQAQADNYLKSDCASAEKSVNGYNHKYHWSQNQFDALVSFTFNCGSGNLHTLLNHGQRTISEISAKITAYNKAGGKVLQGLVNRRKAEKELFDQHISSSAPSTAIPVATKLIKPVSYLQTDPKWKNYNYSAKGEQKTIGSSGCGVTAAAMVIAALKNKSVTPITTAEWSMAHGFKALNQGTHYTYFVPQLSEYKIACKRLNTVNLYGQSSSTAHTEALNALKKGDWVIACMGRGNWTSSGHFILLYKYDNGYVHINDPASTKAARIKNTWDLFAKQVKYLWTIDVPDGLVKPNTPSLNDKTEYPVELLGKIITRSGGLNIRSAPDPSSVKTGIYQKGELVPLTAKTSTNWYRTDKGYISGEYVAAARGRVANCAKLNMRKEPEAEANNIVSVLNANDEVCLMKRAGNGWFQAKTKDGLVGYVSYKYIAVL